MLRRSFLRLGLAYAGSGREEVLSLLLPVMGDSKSNMEVRDARSGPEPRMSAPMTQRPSSVDSASLQVVGVTALACGLIAVGTCNGDVTSTIMQTIMEKSEQELKDTYARWLPLGLGLNHLGKACAPMGNDSLACQRVTSVCHLAGKGDAIETTLAALQVVPEPFRSFANTLVDICAYAGQNRLDGTHLGGAVRSRWCQLLAAK